MGLKDKETTVGGSRACLQTQKDNPAEEAKPGVQEGKDPMFLSGRAGLGPVHEQKGWP